jgi:ATP-dependent Clp protease ATP-binding subunit ClpA
MTLMPTNPAQAAFQLASESATELGHEALQAEHLLIGLLGLQLGSAAAAMDSVGVDRATLQERLAQSLPPGTEGERQKEYPYAPSGLAAVQRAVTAAQTTPRRVLTSAQVMLGVLGHPPIRDLLEELGVPIVRLIHALQARIGRSE